MRTSSREKVVFSISLVVLAFVAGYFVRASGWFPDAVLRTAISQADRELGPPDFVGGRVYEREGARTVAADRVQPGPTLLTSMWEEDSGWKPGLELIDRKGETLHSWRVDPETLFPESANRRGLGMNEFDFQGSYLFPDGDVLVNLEYVGTVRLDACSRVRWRLPAGGHHSIDRAGDGSFWIPGVTREPRRKSPNHPGGLPGIPEPVYQDQILRVTADGRLLDSINVLDVLYANGLQRFIFKSGFETEEDVTHLNDVEALPDSLASEYPLFRAGDLVVSLRNQDLVFVLDPESERVKWHASEPFIRQHDPDFIGGGWIGVFDNNRDATDRGTISGGSRILAVQPHTDSTRVLFPGEDSEPFYTEIRGKWQRLENGNLLLTESVAGRVVEVTPEGRTVWDWVASAYDERSVPYVSKGMRLDMTPEDVAAWPCSPGEGGAAHGESGRRAETDHAETGHGTKTAHGAAARARRLDP